ncbi:glycosyltransferase family 4 protein [Polaribacter aestuariivivens]|uniref:Glycosyltransferase family 4 protein n=1 Tax=Polaribacter aestuariivivens TaxID=2304626 RepID=A0A5S3N456_9FLAO|nr:glycosyltransferase family 4 protein [Polaribacter aestuariivivens]TMM29907.1 glycosyltransferase family 4 protein [Polaribacter aestuariivivens]
MTKKVLFIGPFPNPISGVSLANEVAYNLLSQSKNNKVSKIDTSYPVFQEDIGTFSFKKFLFFLGLNFKFYKILNNDVIYFTPGQTFFGILKYAVYILIGSLFKKELIIHVHGNHLRTEYLNLEGFKKRIFHYLISKCNKGIVLSESLKTNLIPFLPQEKIFILHNFAEDYLFQEGLNVDNSLLKITYLSNLMEEKGILFLLDSLYILEKQNIPYEAKIAGNIDESLKKKIHNKLSKLNNTNYIGVVEGDAKKELLQWSNTFILPTFYKMEGQPISIIEALATNNVIITTKHAGIPDIIKNGFNGFLVEPKNAIAIFEKLEYLSNNLNEIEIFAQRNRKYFNTNFTIDKFGRELKNIINA